MLKIFVSKQTIFSKEKKLKETKIITCMNFSVKFFGKESRNSGHSERRRWADCLCLKRRSRGAASRRAAAAVKRWRTAALKLANSISWKNFFSVVRRALLQELDFVVSCVCFSNFNAMKLQKKATSYIVQWTVRKVSDNCTQGSCQVCKQEQHRTKTSYPVQH